MGKDERFNSRIDPDLKSWFKRYASTRGGMSRMISDFIEGLHLKATGHLWSERHGDNGDNGAAEAKGTGRRGGSDPSVDHPRAP